jgi:hypothetical protein
MSSAFDFNRTVSWQRLAIVAVLLVVSTTLLLTGYVDDTIWRDVNIATAVAFVGSEVGRHLIRARQTNLENDGAP